jgi:hypothetical protein
MKKYLVSLSVLSLLFVNLAYASHYPQPSSVKTSNPVGEHSVILTSHR